jgi:hypothetical protein
VSVLFPKSKFGNHDPHDEWVQGVFVHRKAELGEEVTEFSPDA